MKFLVETLAERVILKPLIKRVSGGGIALIRDPRNNAINTDKGEIVAIGPQAWYDLPSKPELKVGDKVLYSHYGAKIIRNEDQPDPDKDDAYFVICNDRDILVGYAND
jgi:co-chaperonin GroES (HSP10)